MNNYVVISQSVFNIIMLFHAPITNHRHIIILMLSLCFQHVEDPSIGIADQTVIKKGMLKTYF